MSRDLPAKPSLEHLKKQAKDLLHSLRRGDSAAIEQFQSLASISARSAPKLADAQHVIARDYGFASWSKLKEHVQSLVHAPEPAEMLTAAIRASNAAHVGNLLERYPELRAKIDDPLPGYGFGQHALFAAVQRSDRATVDVLLHAGANIQKRTGWWAGGFGVLDDCDPSMVEFLTERGAVLDAHSASRLGTMAKLRELVPADPRVVRARGGDGQTPLHFASTVEVAEFLLANGAEIDARDVDHESTPAQYMLRVNQARHYPRDRQDVARYLVSRGCRTDILMAAALGDLELARRHLESDPACIRTRVSEAYFPKQNPQSGGTIYIYIFGKGRTPHQIARDFGHEELFQFLMEHSPEDVKLAQACDLGDEKMFRAMLTSHPNLIATLSDDDRRRLTDAAQNNNTRAVRLMLEAGWPVDTRGEYDMTPLQWAAWHGNAEMVREILRHKARLELKDNHHGITALGCALHGSKNGWHRDTGEYVATVEALLNAGAKAPRVTDDLEASESVRDLLRRRAQS
jgi:ankyrin repeat protein